MKYFEQMTQFANGCKIDHLPERSVTILKHPKGDGVIIEMRRGDVTAKLAGLAPPVFKIEVKDGQQIEVTGVAISIECAMALLLGLNDYFKRVEPAEGFV